MNARQPDEPIPFLTKEEHDALVLEFQRLAARLAQARLIAPATSTRLMRTIHRSPIRSRLSPRGAGGQ